jgi:hypothetical protein
VRGIYSHLDETNHVSRVYSFAVVLYLQFVVQVHVMLFVAHVMLFVAHVMLFNISTVKRVFFYFSINTVSSAQCPIWLFFVLL